MDDDQFSYTLFGDLHRIIDSSEGYGYIKILYGSQKYNNINNKIHFFHIQIHPCGTAVY